MSFDNTPAGADCDPFCPWNAKEDEDAERCECGAFLDDDGNCEDECEVDDEELEEAA